ncbi:O-methyltransferase-domain-containing protein [Coniochaeta sp. 2T2.1]|nr:O-methyltransferase-domain-containing protein [Coniochaeta sp. 2T2.1]
MVKFKLSSLLNSSSSSSNGSKETTTAETKKQNRRSFSGFLDTKSTPSKPKMSSEEPSSTNGSAIPSSPPSRMAYLAQKIAAETASLEAALKEANLPPPSFDTDADPDYAAKLPPAARVSRQEIIHATKELRDLTIGTRESVRWLTWGHLDSLALQTINAFGIAKLFPVDETITLTELTARSKLDKVNLARLVRYAITNHIFREPTPGVIAHTAASRCMAEDEDMQAWIGFNTEDIFPASAHVLQALRTYPEAVHLTQTGFNFAFGTVDQEPMFVTFGKDPVRAKRMGRAMASLTGGEGYETKYVVEGGYDFTEIDRRGGTFVDVGGSHGFACVEVGRRYRNMRFVVQDLPKTVETAPKPICEDEQVAERIRLEAHDFFTEQTLKDADVYFFRWIMHNYSTPYAIKLIKNLVPALKPGARILIMDHCLTEPGTENPWDEKQIRSMDLIMLALLNAQERTEEEFRGLFAAADEGFVFKVSWCLSSGQVV